MKNKKKQQNQSPSKRMKDMEELSTDQSVKAARKASKDLTTD